MGNCLNVVAKEVADGMGELQKRIEAFLNDFYKYYKAGNPPRNDRALIQRIIEEAKKEFPLKRAGISNYPDAIMFEDVNKILEWFERWFGDAPQ